MSNVRETIIKGQSDLRGKKVMQQQEVDTSKDLWETRENWLQLDQFSGRAENICPHQMPPPLYDHWDHGSTQHLYGMF